MLTAFLRPSVRLLPAVILCAAVAAPAAAQEKPAELDSWHIPGWTFTPGVVIGGLYDSNVTLASVGDASTPVTT